MTDEEDDEFIPNFLNSGGDDDMFGYGEVNSSGGGNGAGGNAADRGSGVGNRANTSAYKDDDNAFGSTVLTHISRAEIDALFNDEDVSVVIFEV